MSPENIEEAYDTYTSLQNMREVLGGVIPGANVRVAVYIGFAGTNFSRALTEEDASNLSKLMSAEITSRETYLCRLGVDI